MMGVISFTSDGKVISTLNGHEQYNPNYQKEKDVARIEVPCVQAVAPIETLSMIFKTDKKGTTLLIGWDDHYVEVPFKRI